jgi:predicted DCC family thiol-disulfide oxidoreductase YuxK
LAGSKFFWNFISVNTETTDMKEVSGWVLYDADCRFCIALAKRFRVLLAARHFELLPLQTPWVRQKLDLANHELLSEMRLLKPDGTMLGGVDALLEISRPFPLAWPIRQLAQIAAIKNVFQGIYRWIARHRHCVSGACEISGIAARQPSRWLDYLPLVVLPLLAVAFKAWVAPWLFMWGMAFALYAGCKWLTYRIASRNVAIQNPWRVAGYLLAWPGMDAVAFLNREEVPTRPRSIEWALALIKTGLGFALLFGVTRILFPNHPPAAGWMGMCGAIFILHFGLFHILSLSWRQAGVNAAPLMRRPLAATSLNDFWGKRWNAAFNELAFRFAYRPLRRRTNPAAATLGVFGLSGVIHELVISLPAHGGYGLPTAYFLIQGFGLVLERSPFGRRIGLGQGLRGRFFALAVTAGPAFWLFHPPFIHNVILPMFKAIGAT